MNQELVELIFGSALHDIGKVYQRGTSERGTHSKLGSMFMKNVLFNDTVDKIIKYHHAKDLGKAEIPDNHMVYIAYIADNISSGIDRRHALEEQDESSYMNWDKYTNLHDIFNIVYERSVEERFYEPVMLDDREQINFPSDSYMRFSQGYYDSIIDRLRHSLSSIEVSESYLPSLFNILEGTLTYVPSSTNTEELRDISLYDHLKLTAAFASVIYHYLKENNIDNYKEVLFKNSTDFYKVEAYRLLNFDISGIQNFIYEIKDKDAAKSLRARSFYLEMLAENLVDEIVTRLELGRANLIYSGGGNAYIMIPNTEKAVNEVEKIEKEINEFLRNTYGSKLYIAFASTAFSGDTVMQNPKKYEALYQAISQEISKKKSARYSADDIRELISLGKKTGRECSICSSIDDLSEDNRCRTCEGLIKLSKPLQTKDFFLVSKDDSDYALPLGFDKYLRVIDETYVTKAELVGKVYSKNKLYTEESQGTRLWVGDYSYQPFFNKYAEGGVGINRLGVMRCDVDDLGQAFMSGFSGKYNTMSRSATFSRNMTLFFQFYINKILEEKEYKITIIYSGGDDVFVVGEWFDVIKFAIELREQFIEYTQGKLTLSTGIGMFHPRTPVPILAKQTGDLEKAAKNNEKDSIALFNEETVYKWDVFINDVWNDKFSFIENYFDNVNYEVDQRISFIYNLLDLIRSSFDEAKALTGERGEFKTISWARWVYYLTRMEPNEEIAKARFKEFSSRLHKMFMDEEEVKQLETALELYVYSIRGDE